MKKGNGENKNSGLFNWLYEDNGKYRNKKGELEKDAMRYTLGSCSNDICSKVLVCVGVNPSSAIPGDLDKTVERVKNKSISEKYDAWVMLNLYPQRATEPKNIDEEFDKKEHKKNVAAIEALFRKIKDNDIDCTIWAAWGDPITTRRFLYQTCLPDIVDVTKKVGKYEWVCLGKTNKLNPYHPSPRGKEKGFIFNPFQPFEIEAYLEKSLPPIMQSNI